ncbi:glycine--tRNA ligase [Agreia pratensis]|jgi:glycyl-tRNA synthetase|uniref:Glycine--tRNA ligase n=1 Tax=Agreia pratensis TaxID=150121 RepID=A0A1X7JLN9_9MICO|nr:MULTISPECIES: glycine--tRNA ligase [Agreia]KQO10012.1 glycine--tRNA ligase [Agreia sp. Leaf244]MBF4634862.1 glycine--tRNA ligase [Agreia pratensis]SMG28867.1 glycyl-tRNA synthetase [Agreia pratensis]
MPTSPLDSVIALAKRRGFVFPTGEIYGGTRSAWDYGPLGVELKENIKRQWWKFMVQSRDNVVGLDSAVILPRQVWEASGHVEVFNDPMVESLATNKRYRADHLLEAYEAKHGHPPVNGLADVRDPDTGNVGQWSEVKKFSGMLKTTLGVLEDESGMAYLRPETAQGIFVDFATVLNTSRQKPPFGIAQVGKAFRNEITPGNFIFRTREFEQMEMEYFVQPGTDEEAHQYWIDQSWEWFIGLGINPENIRQFEHPQEKLSHYSKRTVDIEYRFQFPGSQWGELMGVANRTDFDLKTHSEASGTDLSYFDQTSNERWIPYVIEPSFGLTRALMAFLVDSYHEDEAPNSKGGVDKRTVLKLDPRIAPVKAAVLPLSRNEALSPLARKVAQDLRQSWNVDFDDAGAIGRRYRRQDEIGTPFAITVDFESLEDNAVTVRERDSMAQERVSLDRLQAYLAERLIGA